MAKAICVQCRKINEYVIRKTNDTYLIKGELVKYKKKTAYCKKCGAEVWVADVDDYNANAPWKEYQRLHNNTEEL